MTGRARSPLPVTLVAAAALSVLGAAPVESTDWPSFRGDPSLTGVARGELPDEPSPQWVYEADDAITAGAADGTVFFGDAAGMFHAVDAASGAKRWTFETGGEIASSATVHGDRVLFGSHDQNLYALRRDDGALLWKVETDGYVYGTPAIAGETVISAGCDGLMRVISIADGAAVRSIDMGGYVGASPAVVDGRAFVGTFENQFVAVDVAEGKVAWTYEHPTRKFPYFASAAVADGIVVVGGRDKINAFDAVTGEERWSRSTRAKIDASTAIVGDRAIVATAAGEVLVLDLRTGEPRWTFDTGVGIVASPVVAAGRLVIGTDDGRLFCFGAGGAR